MKYSSLLKTLSGLAHRSLGCWIALQSGLVIADVTMPAIFSDHMVLQRDTLVPVWGKAEPGEVINVSFAGHQQTATTDADGKWMVKLSHLSSGAVAQLIVSGKNQIVINDVLVGEVWLGSGQSNMAMAVKTANNFENEQSNADLPSIRMFKEESAASSEEQAIGKGQWLICSPETVGSFSATLYFFGREIHTSLGVPVGLINSSVGGTPIESWIAADVQRASKDLRPFFQDGDKVDAAASDAEAASYETDLATWRIAAKKAREDKVAIPRKPINPADVKNRKGNVGGLFNGKIAPLIPYAIRGAIWYQGEANSTPKKAPFYEYQLPLLVNDWRSRWGYDFPFAWAQLPNFSGEGRDWPKIREAMLKALALPHTGMGINIDIGEEKNIHPKDKQEVGRRLSLWALGTVYGTNVASTSGPLPSGHEMRGSEMVLAFTHTDGGLKAKSETLLGFEIAGTDMQWKPAQARIEGDTVVVSHAEIKAPVAARYAWANFPNCNLYNGAGLPATPFRSLAAPSNRN